MFFSVHRTKLHFSILNISTTEFQPIERICTFISFKNESPNSFIVTYLMNAEVFLLFLVVQFSISHFEVVVTIWNLDITR